MGGPIIERHNQQPLQRGVSLGALTSDARHQLRDICRHYSKVGQEEIEFCAMIEYRVEYIVLVCGLLHNEAEGLYMQK